MGGPNYAADGTISYNFAAISDVAVAIGSFQGAMDGSLRELFEEFQRVFGANWEGEAKAACEAAQRKWNAGADEIKAALGQVGVALGASAERMRDIDRQIAATF